MNGSVGVVVPAYRPNASILRRFLAALDTVIDPSVIRVELDAPTDSTLEALEDTSAVVHVADERRGKGAAITYGFEHLDTDVLAFADADGSTPAESIADIVDSVRSGNTDLAVGSRRHPDADVKSHQSVVRQRLGDGFAWLARRLLDVSLFDYQCGAKAMNRSTWSLIRDHLYEPGFAWDIEVIAIADALGCEIEEVPVTWIDHPESTVSARRAVPELLGALFVSRHRARRLEGDPIHTTIARQRTEKPPLVNRDR